MAVYKAIAFTPSSPKRTRIGSGKRVRTRLNQGRTQTQSFSQAISRARKVKPSSYFASFTDQPRLVSKVMESVGQMKWAEAACIFAQHLLIDRSRWFALQDFSHANGRTGEESHHVDSCIIEQLAVDVLLIHSRT